MSVLNTFYIMFRSNADDIKKGMREVDKASKETERSLKNSNEEAYKLGESFVKIVESGTAALAAFTSFAAIKGHVLNQTEYNDQLRITAALLGQNAQTLKTMAQAAFEAHGTRAGALADMTGIAQRFGQMGIAAPDMQAYFKQIREVVKQKRAAGAPATAITQWLQTMDLNDQGDQMRMLMPDAEYDATLKSAGSVTPLTEESLQNAKDAIAAQAHLDGAMGNLDTTIGNGLMPTINKWIDKVATFTNWSAGDVKTALAVTATGVLGGAAAKAGAVGWALRTLGLGAKAAPAVEAAAGRVAMGDAGVSGISGVSLEAGGAATGAGLGTLALIGSGIGALGYDIYGGTALLYAAIGKKLAGISNVDPNADYSLAPLSASHAAKKATSGADPEEYAFWASKGYTPAQIAGIIASRKVEDPSGDPNQTGDSGAAIGSFQWHSSRRASILKGTGIDIAKATKQQQWEAAYWEMTTGTNTPGFDDAHYRSLTDPRQTGAYFSDNFESPADRYGQALARGQSALALASSYQVPASKTINVTLGDITINTQATDANDIAQNLLHEVNNQLSQLAANSDDGIAK